MVVEVVAVSTITAEVSAVGRKEEHSRMAEQEACKRLGQVLQGVAPAAVVDTVVVAVVVLGDSAWQVRHRHVVPQEREGAVPQRTVAAMDNMEDKTDRVTEI